ncbi:hypothetical protein [Sorangium sp. So ce542]|uniref:hypothetical protein n=1 Tax=Sorangium sp. So ce542 TaxID=3133316 RepID=UPI003F5F1004
MTRAMRTTRIRTMAIGVTLVALGAGAALLGASCNLGQCAGRECPDYYAGTCPWHCAEPVWDGTSYSVEGFKNSAVFAVWVGSPLEAPDCASSNYFHEQDLYQEPKSIDRCPRCVAESQKEEWYRNVELRKGGHCADSTYNDASIVSEFVVPIGWDGSCLSQRADVVPAPDDVDLAMGTPEGGAYCRTSLSLEDVDALWGKMVRLCRRYWRIDQYCDGLGTLCIPPMGPGFRECLEYRGDGELRACPRTHPELVQAYSKVAGCSECSFDASGDRRRTRTLTFYTDEQCTQPISSTDASGNGQCFDLPPGAFPRSVSATLTVESVPVCEPGGGEQEGELRPYGRASFCCRPPA